MGRTHENINPALAQWIRQQKMFFVATAARTGRINVSPKGYAERCFAVISPLRVAFLEVTGSGAETSAHLMEDGRIVVLFVALDGEPRIVRLHGRACCVPRSRVRADVLARFSEDLVASKGFRAVVLVDVERVSQSCGYSIPIYEFKQERSKLLDHFDRMSAEEVEAYQVQKNSFSIDGRPGVGHRAYRPEAPLVHREQRGGYWYATPGWSASEWIRELVGVSPSRRDLFVFGAGACAAALAILWRPRARLAQAPA